MCIIPAQMATVQIWKRKLGPHRNSASSSATGQGAVSLRSGAEGLCGTGFGTMFDTAQLPYTCSAAALMSLQPILVTLSKNEAGRFDYSVPMSTMLSEVPPALSHTGVSRARAQSREWERAGEGRRHVMRVEAELRQREPPQRARANVVPCHNLNGSPCCALPAESQARPVGRDAGSADAQQSRATAR